MKDVFRNSLPGRIARFSRREAVKLQRYGRDLPGIVQLRLGRQPTLKGTSYLSLQQWKAVVEQLPPPDKGDIALFAIQNKTWVKWTVYAGCQLLRLGYRPVVVFSTKELKTIYPVRGLAAVAARGGYGFWEGARGLPGFEFVDLDDHLGNCDSLAEMYADFGADWAHTVAAYELGVEEHEPDRLAPAYDDVVNRTAPRLRDYGAAVERMLTSLKPARVICPSGLIGLSISVLEACRRTDTLAAFVEAWGMRPGHMIWNVNRPVLEYDVEGWMGYVQEDVSVAEHSDAYMAFQERTRTKKNESLQNTYRPVQRSTMDAPFPPDLDSFLRRNGPHFLLGTNVIGDSATFRRSTLFRSQRHWVGEVVRFFVEHPGINLVFRAHPDEVTIKAVQRLGDVAAAAAGDAPNVFVLHGHDDVNTYSMLDHVDVGLAWVSNVGLDMALRGLPVLLAARAAYGGLGLCGVPTSVSDYFSTLVELGEAPQAPEPEAIERGKTYQNVLTRFISLKASVPGWNAANFRLGPEYDWPEQQKFYRILVGELDDKGRS